LDNEQIEEVQDQSAVSSESVEGEGGGSPELEGEALEKALAGQEESSTSEPNEADLKAHNRNMALERIENTNRTRQAQLARETELKSLEDLKAKNQELEKQIAGDQGVGPAPTMEQAGHDTDKFQRMYSDWHQKQSEHNLEANKQAVKHEISEQFKTMNNQKTDEQLQNEYQETVSKHYKRADEMKVSDYQVKEKAAIEVLGDGVVNEIINNFPDSQKILYHLGASKKRASDFGDICKRNPNQAYVELGKISERLSRLTNRPRAVEPEIQISGAGTKMHGEMSYKEMRKEKGL